MRIGIHISPLLIIVMAVAALAVAASATASTTASASASTALAGGKCGGLDNLATSLAAAMTPNGNVSSLNAELATLRSFSTHAPASVRNDFKVLANTFAKVAAVFKGGMTAASASKLQSLASTIKAGKVVKAETAIGTWAATDCK